MVRALLDGSKTQTRRVVKGSDAWPSNTHHATTLESRGTAMAVDSKRCTFGPEIKNPYGKIGDQLWVRETFCEVPMVNIANGKTSIFIEFAAGKKFLIQGKEPAVWESYKPEGMKWKPSIFMPRAASRITLEVTSVRVERLQDISRGDCMAEGCPFPNIAKETDPKQWYRDLWETINGAGSWDLNPWVWVIEFKKVKP
jgi:hypothetical protein